MTDAASRGVLRRVQALRARLAQRRRMLEEQRLQEERELEPGPREAEPVQVVVRPEPQAYDADQTHPVPYAVRATADWSWRFLAIVAAFALIGWVAWQLRVVVFSAAIGLLLAALLAPMSGWLRRRGWHRGLAAAATFIAFLVVISGSLTIVGGAVSGQFGEVAERAGEGVTELQDWFAGPPFYLTEQQIDEWVDRIVAAVGDQEEAITEGALTTATTALEFFTGVVIALFSLVMFLYDGPGIWSWTVRLFPRTARARVDGAGVQAWRTLTSFVRGTTLVALFDATFITILLLILQVPLALPLGVLVFFGAYVPLVGAFITGTLAVLVALVANGLVTALIVLAGIIAIQQIEGNVFQPLVLGRMTRVHPLAVVLVITIGVLTGGILGALVAVPITATANAVIKYLMASRGEGALTPTSG